MEEVGEPRAQLVAVALAEAAEHVLRPRQDRRVLRREEVVHRRLVGVEAGDLGAQVAVGALHVGLVTDAQELDGRLRVQRVDVVLGALLHDVQQPPVARRDLPREHVLEREVRRQVDQLAARRDREGGHRRRALEVQVAAVLAGQAGEPRAAHVDRDALDVALREVRPRLQHALVGGAAGPIHLVVDPRLEVQPLALLDREPDAIEGGLADVRRLESVAAVQDDPRHPLLAQLAQLPAHLVGVELAVEEPEREDPVLARGPAEALAVELQARPRRGDVGRQRAHRANAVGTVALQRAHRANAVGTVALQRAHRAPAIATVALTNPSGRSTAVANAALTSSSAKRCETRSSSAIRPEVSRRIPARIPRMISWTSRKWALTISNAIQFHAPSGSSRAPPWWKPTIATLPLMRVASPIVASAAWEPVTSNATSAPAPSVASRTASASDSARGFTVRVAPRRRARSSASGRVSQTIT